MNNDTKETSNNPNNSKIYFAKFKCYHIVWSVESDIK